MFPLAAGGYPYRPLRLTDPMQRGWDVYALQVALRISADGIFGRQTELAVRGFQSLDRELQTTVDGIAGTHTQRRIAFSLIWDPQSEYDTPPGLIRGVLEGESGFLLGNYTKPYSNGTRDVGLTMLNVSPMESNLQLAFAGPSAVRDLAKLLRQRKDAALAEASRNDGGRLLHPDSRCRTHEGAWKYGSILRWNWPAASVVYVDGTVDSWTYAARFVPGKGEDEGFKLRTNADGSETRGYQMGDRAQWVVRIGVAGVETGFEWAEHYITTKAHYADLEHF